MVSVWNLESPWEHGAGQRSSCSEITLEKLEMLITKSVSSVEEINTRFPPRNLGVGAANDLVTFAMDGARPHPGLTECLSQMLPPWVFSFQLIEPILWGDVAYFIDSLLCYLHQTPHQILGP